MHLSLLVISLKLCLHAWQQYPKQIVAAASHTQYPYAKTKTGRPQATLSHNSRQHTQPAQ